MKSVMKHQFSEVPQAKIPRSSFDRSHGHKTTFDAGLLIPIFVDEALPGDTFNLNMTAFARMATPIKPIMDNLYMETFFFAVPYRLVWDGWVKMMGEVDYDDTNTYITPPVLVPQGGFLPNQLGDYMGLPIYAEGDFVCSALPLRAYNLIYNEWFRDQNLSPMRPVNRDSDGPDDKSDYSLMYRAKRHDYFTSCLPWPQKGEDVAIPTLGLAPVIGTPGTLQEPIWRAPGGNQLRLRATDGINEITWHQPSDTTGLVHWHDPMLSADLSEATTVTINDLRTAFQFQKLLERDARGGTRYTELIRSHFGVTSPDARLQRPEFLGGGSTRINVKPVEQTSNTDSQTTPQGNLAAMATANVNGHGFTKSFTEHSIVIGLVNVRADLTYQDGINRMWLRQSKYDFYWPALAHLGEQEVYDFEIWAKTNLPPLSMFGLDDNEKHGKDNSRPGPLSDNAIFGYQERFAEYRYKPSLITGNFRSDHAASLDIWHLSQDFDSVPLLNDVFISDVPPLDRVIATPGEPHFLFDAYFDFKCARPMPLYGVPGNIDRF